MDLVLVRPCVHPLNEGVQGDAAPSEVETRKPTMAGENALTTKAT